MAEAVVQPINGALEIGQMSRRKASQLEKEHARLKLMKDDATAEIKDLKAQHLQEIKALKHYRNCRSHCHRNRGQDREICKIQEDEEICMIKFGIGDKAREQMKIHRLDIHKRHQCESKDHKNCYKHYSDTNGRNKHMRKILKEKPEKTKSEKAKKTEKTKRKPKADVADGWFEWYEKTTKETKIREPEFEKDHLERLEDDLASSKKEVAVLKCIMAKVTTDFNDLRAEFESLHCNFTKEQEGHATLKIRVQELEIFFFFRFQCESKLDKNCFKHYSAKDGHNKHMRNTHNEKPEKPEKTKIEKAENPKKTEKPKRKPLADVADTRKNKRGLDLLENKIRELELQKGRLERESREVSDELVDLSKRSSWKKKKTFF
ncbi:hypothetical protein DAPPUDRAFT_326606 [Daphnia pulex]|uniref:C2H2-type domain-containing protein n=1 Tax=Daphnia pulex TaxID=6669 RepID=E9H889_DAPPU|nr:hypothetical protein DAPPUDRAFT_326606 [Daphnia pulex]|eukprot:EFX72071.1 hypothetical protein DAPPUDRAFT_326606 [Daphnia pulex]